MRDSRPLRKGETTGKNKGRGPSRGPVNLGLPRLPLSIDVQTLIFLSVLWSWVYRETGRKDDSTVTREGGSTEVGRRPSSLLSLYPRHRNTRRPEKFTRFFIESFLLRSLVSDPSSPTKVKTLESLFDYLLYLT